MKQTPQNERVICFMNSNRVWGGGEKWHYETATYLSEIGYRVIVITNRHSHLYQKVSSISSIEVFAYRISNFSFINPFKVLALSRLLKRKHVDTIVLGLSNDVKAGGIAARLAGVNKVIYRRGTAITVNNSLFNRYLFGRVLTSVVANSEEIKNTIFGRNDKIIHKDRVRIIYNGIKLNLWENNIDLNRVSGGRREIIIGNAGRLVEQKDHVTLIHIGNILKQKNVAFEIRIAGSGELEPKLKRLCDEEGLSGNVVFMDFVEDMRSFLKDIDIYCSTSKHEGSSHVILEAMAAGKPLIAFDVSSFPEMIQEGVNGYLIPDKNKDAYAARIMEFQQDRGKLFKMGHQSRKMVEEQFDFSKKAKEFLELIEVKEG